MRSKPIFFDPTGKRARLLQGLAWALGALSASIMVGFFAILMIVHRPGNDSFDQQLRSHASIRCAWAPTCSAAHGITVTTAADPELLKSASMLAAELRGKERDLRIQHPQAEVLDRHPIPAALRGATDRPLSIGFYVNWDDNSYRISIGSSRAGLRSMDRRMRSRPTSTIGPSNTFRRPSRTFRSCP